MLTGSKGKDWMMWHVQEPFVTCTLVFVSAINLIKYLYFLCRWQIQLSDWSNFNWVYSQNVGIKQTSDSDHACFFTLWWLNERCDYMTRTQSQWIRNLIVIMLWNIWPFWDLLHLNARQSWKHIHTIKFLIAASFWLLQKGSYLVSEFYQEIIPKRQREKVWWVEECINGSLRSVVTSKLKLAGYFSLNSLYSVRQEP